MLFICGNGMSVAPNVSGTSQISEITKCNWRNYKENYNNGVSCNSNVVDLVISD
jgi:hypothetical protein